MTVTFSERDLEIFSKASGDKNPLHLSASYARRTSFGQPVVFGVLGVLACLSDIDPGRQRCVRKIAADFHRPMFVGVTYTLTKSTRGDEELVRIFDGSINVLSAAFQFGAEWREEDCQNSSDDGVFARQEAAKLTWGELKKGFCVTGEYCWDQTNADLLIERLNLTSTSRPIVECLLWSSYLTGMELPGETALFFRLVINFKERAATNGEYGGFRYSVETVSTNDSISQLKVRGELTADQESVAEATMLSFARRSVAVPDFTEEDDAIFADKPLRGKVALVLGASRGFGAALTVALANAGATVVGSSRSESEWTKNHIGMDKNAIEMVNADAADPIDLASLRSHIENRHGRLDFLVCSAFPSIPSLRLEENALERLKAYIASGIDLVLTPLCTFLGALNKCSGTLVLISTSALDEPVREWPHYLAAKAANENLARVAQMQYERIQTLVFRPERMETDMTNTPMGRAHAESPGRVAVRLVRRLIDNDPRCSFEVASSIVRSRPLETADI